MRQIKRWTWCLPLGLLLLTTTCRAQGHCAWLNDATASGVLSGPVVLTLETGADDLAVCTFTYQKTPIEYSALRIQVQPVKDPSKDLTKAVSSHEVQCTSTATALKAIGNEAVTCSADVGYARGEQVIGRVRDRLFIVNVSSSAAQDPTMTRALLQEKVRLIAEQVAGALF
jgi:hypothetical protein